MSCRTIVQQSVLEVLTAVHAYQGKDAVPDTVHHVVVPADPNNARLLAMLNEIRGATVRFRFDAWSCSTCVTQLYPCRAAHNGSSAPS